MAGWILIIEDDVLVAENIADILRESGYNKIYISDNEIDVENFQLKKTIDLVISDINLHGIKKGINIVKKIQLKRHIPVIYLSAYSEEQIVDESLTTNPTAYVLKPFIDRQLLVAVRIALKQIEELHQHSLIDKPSLRELNVIEQIAKGLSNKEIADFLTLSEHTIKTHRRNLIRKYQLRSSSELITMAIKLKWINFTKS